MMRIRWIPDPTGRFEQRPHFPSDQLDDECESIVSDYLHTKYGRILLPIPTDDLTCLIERDVETLDLFADLRDEGDDVEGVTIFRAGHKPIVRISKLLTENTRRHHRLRTTLTHEYGHVRFHQFLYELSRSWPMFPAYSQDAPARCKRATILSAPTHDWMEWQAGYACGAFLMPITEVKSVVRNALTDLAISSAPTEGSIDATALIRRVSGALDVSTDAARVRLSRLGYIAKDPQQARILPA